MRIRRLFRRQRSGSVTPFLLGWMSAAIVRQLNSASEDAGDLAASIDLFHRARDSSGLSPWSHRRLAAAGLFERPIRHSGRRNGGRWHVGRLSRWNSRDDWSGRGKSPKQSPGTSQFSASQSFVVEAQVSPPEVCSMSDRRCSTTSARNF